ncbi:MAG TPA: DUF4364 family protein [Clostridia bacterium]|nr:DUF4364 family protein [Clostridia bacterium]
MIPNIKALADDKLSILYLIDCLGIPLTNGQVTRFFTDYSSVNYFDLQQYLIELISGGLVDEMATGNSQFISITPKGREALSYFRKRISPHLRNIIESYAEKNRSSLKDENQITADYKKITDKEYEVICRVMENELVLMELKLNVPNSQQAKQICEKWRLRAPEVFKAIYDRLV